jgi:predicted small lipoprotein YifL
MFKTLIILMLIVFIAAITSGCGVTGKLKLPEGQQKETVF